MSLLRSLILAVIILYAANSYAQNPVNWTADQLVKPSELAQQINTNRDVPVVISVGPGAPVLNSVNVGMVNNKEGIEKLKQQLDTVSRDKKIVIYCGCCPFEHCPNVRPAINVLKDLKFTNYYLLDLPNNIKKDWIDKGFPVNKS